MIRWETFADVPARRRLRIWSRFVPSGEYYGIGGQTVAGVASLAGVMLVWTGISMALRRLFAWKARRGRSAPVEAPQTVGVGADDAV